MSVNSDDWICLSAQNKRAITPDNRGLAYGDGFFTTMGVIDGVILWQDYHQQRICSHAKALQLDIDSLALVADLIAHANQLQQGMLKLVITRAAQDVRGYGFTPSELGSACEIWLKSSAMSLLANQSVVIAATARLPDGREVLRQPTIIATCLTSQIACLPPTLVGLKTLNRLDNVLASAELQRIKASHPNITESLVRDMTGCWVEGTMSNVFYQLATPPSAAQTLSSSNPNASDAICSDYLLTGQWFTPPLTQSGVTGVLRQVVIDAFASTTKPVIMRDLNDEDLSHVSRLFFCNALRGVMPVKQLVIDQNELM